MERVLGRIVFPLGLTVIGCLLSGQATAARVTDAACYTTAKAVVDDMTSAVRGLRKQWSDGLISLETYNRIYKERNTLKNKYYNLLMKATSSSDCGRLLEAYREEVAGIT